MVNLFRPAPDQQGSLTAALLALLEHSDKSLLGELLERAGIPLPAGAAAPTIRFPAPDAPPGTGLISSGDLQVAVAAQTPGEAWDPDALLESPGVPLAISLTGQAPAGAHGLSWEQVDRWLAAAGERYAPDSRTGFLIEQFRAVLPQLGIKYFAGFEPDLLAEAPPALNTLSRMYQVAGQFFERLGAALGAVRPGTAEIRQARPEELLAGYCYRDYSDPIVGATGFLRIALNLPAERLEAVLWLMPGGPGGGPHARLRELLLADPGLRGALAGLEQEPLLWLWSAAGEQKLPLGDFHPEALEELDWSQYHAGIQTGLPFANLPTEDLTGRVAGTVEAMAGALKPVLQGTVH